MRTSWKKRMLSLFLAVALTFGMVPSEAFAEENSMVLPVSESSVPFTAKAGEKEIAEITAGELTWTDWNGNEDPVTCYTVTIPQGTEAVTLNFQEEMNWTYYDSKGGYIGNGDSSWTTTKTHTIAVQDSNGDGELDGVSVQKPNAYSTAFYILFVYGESQTEESCLSVLKDAPSAGETAAGGLYQLNLKQIFADQEDHDLTYDFTADISNEHTKIVNGVFYFSTTETGTHEVTLKASCSAKTVEHKIKITVKSASEGLDIQYGYEETDKSSVTVYVNISNDGLPILGADDSVLANLKVTVPYFDLSLYGLEQYHRYGTENGKGSYVNDTVIQRPTGLHLYIYLLEHYYMGLPEEECCLGTSGVLEYANDQGIAYFTGESAYESNGKQALQITGNATSLYMANFWGHDENLMYYRNHCYPYMSPGWGATSDYILLSDGDVWDVAMFTNWNFYHSGYFAAFDKDVYSVKQPGDSLTVHTRKWGTTEASTDFVPVNGSEGLNVALYDSQWKFVESLAYTDSESNSITFQVPSEEGIYYLLATDPNAASSSAKIAPASARILVGDQKDQENATVTRILLNTYEEELMAGEDLSLTATVLPAEAKDWTLSWTSDQEAVASVDQTGKVTAKKAGTATITAAIGDIQASCKITVKRKNTAPELQPGAIERTKLQTGTAFTVDVESLFTDKENDELTYRAALCTASSVGSGYDYVYTEKEEVAIDQGKCSVSIQEPGIYALQITASDGEAKKTYSCQLTVVDNNSGKISLGEGITADFYNVVVVDSSEEFVKDFEIPYKGTHDTYVHNIVLSKNTVQGTPHRKMDLTIQDGYGWSQYPGTATKDPAWSTRADIGLFVYDQTGEEETVTAHFLRFYTECETHTDADQDGICDQCTMKLEAGGQFALMAVDAEGMVIEPCYITYQKGATVKQALKSCGIAFDGIDSGFISGINGKADNYSLHYDGDGYSLDIPAEDITALWFTTNSSQGYSEDLKNLVIWMTQYQTSDNGVKEYTAAKNAYAAAEKDFYQTSNSAKLWADLKAAMEKYEAYLTGEQVTVALKITQKEIPVTAGKAVFLSEFGTKTETEKLDQIALIPGTYSFDISDGKFSHVRGTLEVSAAETAVLEAEIPSGNWIGSVDLGLVSGQSKWKAVSKDAVTEAGGTYYVPDYATANLYPYIQRGEGVDTSIHKVYLEGTSGNTARTWESYATALARVIDANSLNGTTLVLECRQKQDDKGYEQYQTYTMNIVRTPSLKALSVTAEGTLLKLDFDKDTAEYEVTTVTDTLDVTPQALCADAVVTVNGQAAESGKALSVKLSECETDNQGRDQVSVKVQAPNGSAQSYQILVTKVADVQVILVAPDAEMNMALYNEAGAEIAATVVQGPAHIYRVIPDQEYTYVITANEHYHATAKFTPTEKSQNIQVPAPKQEDWLKALKAKAGSSNTAPIYALTPVFDPSAHNYSTLVESNSSAFQLQAYEIDSSLYTTEAIYVSHNNTSYSDFSTLGRKEYVKTPGKEGKYVNMNNFLGDGGWSNEMLIKVTQKETESGVTYYQDYKITANRTMTLYSLSAADHQGIGVTLTQKENPDQSVFEKQVYEYTTTIGATQQDMSVIFKVQNSTNGNDYDQYLTKVSCGDWSQEVVFADKAALKADQVIQVPLSGTNDTEEITITVTHKGTGAVAGTYHISVVKLPPVITRITTDPADATIFLTDDLTGSRISPQADDTYILNTDAVYTYVVSKNGYVAQKGSLVAGEANKEISIQLVKAANSTLKDLAKDGDWLQFRADNNNNGAVSLKTPIKAEDAVLEWSNKIGEGMDSGATGCPIIVGGYLYTYAGERIVKVNKETGEVVGTGKMAASSSFAINSPTYAEGMLFVGLSGGRVQAFNAETLESLWLFEDELGGQPNCPIVYCEGYIYTGFWNSETKQAHFVCLSVTDENPESAEEEKLPTWTYTHNGFYWAGAYACKDFVLVGTDDGESGYTKGYASILSLDPKTGELLDQKQLTNVGDQRSSICYDEETDAYYFTTKGGDFYQIKVNADGTFAENSLRRLHLDNGSDNVANPPMSTSTPVIYHGRAYIGVSGTSQFGNYSGHNITVIDLETFSIAYTVPTMGYPQTSGLLTTAYEETDGYVYVYFIDNATPGMIRVIRDKKGMTEVDHSYTSEATYTKNGETVTIETGYILFTPYGADAQYAICSPIADQDGNLYFKNDTARMMRLSSRMDRLEITEQPQQLVYEEGMTFQKKGMKVTAYYANGNKKDVTDYVSFTTDELTLDDTEITVSFDPDMMFENEETQSGGYWRWYQDLNNTAGSTYYLPTATVNIEIQSEHSWDQGEETKSATCTEPGEITYTCTICKETKTEEAAALGHQIEAVSEKKATCKDTGVQAHYKCTECKKLFYDDKGTKEAEEKDLILSKTEEHVWGEWTTEKEATSKEEGLKVRECSVCHEKETEIIAKVISFSDVQNETSFYYNPVYWAAEKGVTTGRVDGTFDPKGNVTRGEMVTFLWRLAGCPEVSLDNLKFTDVGTSSFYAKAIAWAVSEGIAEGTSKTTFEPKAEVTRAQAVTFLWRYAGAPTAAGGKEFKDVPSTKFFYQAVAWASANGVTTGDTAGNFSPYENCNRGSAVTFIYRTYQLQEK